MLAASFVAQSAHAIHDESGETIHISFMENFPKQIQNPDGSYSGFMAEFYEYIAAKMGYKLDLVERSAFRAFRDFQTGDSAYIISTSSIANLDEGVLKSDEVMCISYSFLTKKGNEIKSIEDLSGVRVGYGVAGAYITKYAEQLGDGVEPIITIKTLSATEAIRMLAYGRVDAVFFPTLFYQPILDADEDTTGIPQELKDSFADPYVTEQVNLRVFVHPNSSIYSRGEEFISVVNEAAKDGVFWDILSRSENDKVAFCDMSLK